MYELSCNLIYEMISARFRIKKSSLEKTNSQIYDGEENILSAIANNRRHKKKNKYLIPADTTRSSVPKEYARRIASALEFGSVSKFLWGNFDEVEAYSGELFSCLIKDALNNESSETVTKIETVLQDYIPYAKASLTFGLVEKHPDIATILIESSFPSDIETVLLTHEEAVSRLFCQLKDDYIISISEYLFQNDSTYKLDKRFSDYVCNHLLPLIENTLSDLSLGSEANKMLRQLNEYYLVSFNSELKSSPESLYHTNDRELKNRTIIRPLIAATETFVNELEAIQQKSEEDSWSMIDNKWRSDMCLL